MKKIQIYLAGKMTGLTYKEMNQWREDFLTTVVEYDFYDKFHCINPVLYFNFEEKRYQSDKEVMDFDLRKVSSSDIIVVNLQGLNDSIGTCIELYEAYKRGIPILAIGDDDTYTNLHPWLKVFITRHDHSYREVIEYINDFYGW